MSDPFDPILACDAYLDGELDPRDFEKLQAWLDKDPDAAAILSERAFLHSRLSVINSHEAGRIAPTDPIAEADTGVAIAARLYSDKSRRFSTLFNRTTRRSLGAAALVICLFLTAMYLLTPAAIVANVAGLQEPIWSDNTGWSLGEVLYEGRTIKLDSGVVELTFKDGAVVTIEGPAVFVVEDRGRGRLNLGRLVANVPPAAVGFQIETPTTTITDLGTQFGVKVQASGAADVVVLEGIVVVAQGGAGSQSVRLTQGQRTRVASKGKTIARAEKVDAKLLAEYHDLADTEFHTPTLVATDLNTGGTDIGFSGGWVGSTNVFMTNASDLTYANYGITQAGTTQQVYISNTTHGDRQDSRALATAMSGEMWFSVLVNVPTGGDFAGLSFHSVTPSQPYQHSEADLRVAMSDSQLKVSFNGGAWNDVGSFAAGTTHLILGQMTVVAGTDTISVWVDPDLSAVSDSSDLPTADLTKTTIDFTDSITVLGVPGKTGSASQVYIDAIRLSNTEAAFVDVTGVEH